MLFHVKGLKDINIIVYLSLIRVFETLFRKYFCSDKRKKCIFFFVYLSLIRIFAPAFAR
jgi:hypothetical protein